MKLGFVLLVVLLCGCISITTTTTTMRECSQDVLDCDCMDYMNSSKNESEWTYAINKSEVRRP